MIDPRARKQRLESDYQDMLRIRGDLISFEAYNPPTPERYVVRFKLRSVMSVVEGEAVYSATGYVHQIDLTLPGRYPSALMIDNVRFITPPIFHPNVYTSGRVDIGGFRPSESLVSLVLRLAKMIQFDPAYINEGSPANQEAKNWYGINKGMFPVDRSRLPDPDRSDPKAFVAGPGSAHNQTSLEAVMSIEANRFVPGPIVEPEIEEWTAELDDLPDDAAVHCSTALLRQLMDHAVRYQHTEVFGLLLGRALRTPALKTRTLVLDFLAAERFASSSLTFVEVSAQELIRLDRVHEASPEKKDLRKVGWFHTHPGHGIFMSSTDKANHSMYSNPWQVALVLDPVHHTWGFFAGSECRPIPEVNDGDRAASVRSTPTELRIEKGPAGKRRPINWLFLLIAILVVAQTLTIVGSARVLMRLSELRNLVVRQQERLDALESKIGAISPSSPIGPVEGSEGRSDISADHGTKKK